MNPTEVFEQHRPMLFAIAYRMMGTSSEADDILQEAFLRWHQTNPAEIHSTKAFLATIVTRLALDQLQSARKQRETYVGQWLPEPVGNYVENDESLAESLTLGFLVLLEKLSPSERAVFLLREVFDYEYEEIAEILLKSEESCRQIFSRARKRITEGKPRFQTSKKDCERITREFLHASTTGDVKMLLDLMSDDAILISDGGGKVAAALNPIYGPDRIVRFIAGVNAKTPGPLKSEFRDINGEPAIVLYLQDQLYGVIVPEISGAKIRRIYVINNPDKLKSL